MTALTSRAAAGVGWLAHTIGRLVGSIIWFAPRGVPWALVVALLLAFGAWRSIDAARLATATQPRPEPVGLAAVVDVRAIGWVGTASIVRGPYLDSRVYGASVQRWYYLLIDPNDDSVAMVARSTERLEERRTRTIVARVEEDPAAVATAIAGRDAGGRAVDPRRYLVELADTRPPVLIGASIATPARMDVDAGEIVLRGSFDQGRPAGDGEGWEYLVNDGTDAVIVRSPHPPDALPVDIWGVATTDRVRATQAAAVPELQAQLGDRELPERRLLAEGVTPPLPEISYLLATVLAALAAIIALGWVVGYPLFRRLPLPQSIATWPILPGDELPAALFGTDRRGGRRVIVDGAPGTLIVLADDEVDRRSWQFAMRDSVRSPATSSDEGLMPGVLTLSSGEGPILVRFDASSTDIRLTSGTLVRAGGSRPAIRLRATNLDLLAAFASIADRDRAIVAIAPERRGRVPDGPPPRQAVERPPAMGDGQLPAPLRTAAAVLAAVGALFLAGGAITLPGALAGAADVAPTLGQLVVGIGFIGVARGVWLRRDWADAVGFNVSWIGAAIAGFLVVALPGCGLWLTPNLVACQAIGPLASAGPLIAVIGLGYAALAIRRHTSSFAR